MAKTLKDYTDNELYAELERRGHYDCFEVCVDDLKSDESMYKWAEKNELVGQLMSGWQDNVMIVFEYVEGVWDALDDAAKDLGYDPYENYEEE